MILKSTTNRAYSLEIGNTIDRDGEVCVSIDEISGDYKNIYINKDGAAKIIEHLQKTFGLEK